MIDSVITLFWRARWALLLIVLLALACYAVERFLWSTAVYGIGVRTDSVEYFWTAKNFALGLGFNRLNGAGQLKAVTHWPPFYPMVLSLFEFFQLPALIGARWLGAALTGLIVLLTGLTVAGITRRIWLTLLSAVLLTQAPSLWATSLDAMTEPLYVTLTLGGALLLGIWIERREKWAFGLSALCIAAGFLTRYVGLALVATGMLVLLTQKSTSRGRRDWLARLKEPLLYGMLCILPVLIWMIYNLLRAGSATNRSFELVPIPASEWNLLNELLLGWSAPVEAILQIGAGKMVLIVLVLLTAAVLELTRRQGRLRLNRLHSLEQASQPHLRQTLLLFYVVYALLYPLMILFSRLVFDRLIPIYEERIAFPWYLSLFLLAFFMLGQVFDHLPTRRWWERAGSIGLVVLILLTLYTFGIVYHNKQEKLLELTREKGRGLTGEVWYIEPIKQVIIDLPEDAILYSDNLEVVYFLSGRSSFQINVMNSGVLNDIEASYPDKELFFVVLSTRDYFAQVREQFPDNTVVYDDGEQFVLGVQP